MSRNCFHCGLPTTSTAHTLTVNGEQQHCCCRGCKLASETIFASGLDAFYKFNEPAQHPVEQLPDEQQERLFYRYDRTEAQAPFVTHEGEYERACVLVVEGISCSACTWLIEKRLMQVAGVVDAAVNASTHRLSLRWNSRQCALSTIFRCLYQLGYRAAPFLADEEEQIHTRTRRSYILRLGVAGIGMMQTMMNTVALYSGTIAAEHERWLWWTSLVITLPVMAISAWPFFTSAWQAIRHRQLNMDVSISFALLSAFTASCYATLVSEGDVYFESVTMFTFFLVLTRFLEFQARQRIRQGGNALQADLPVMSHRMTSAGEEEVPVNQLKAGDLIRLYPGELCPVDGILERGQSEFNEGSLSGEFKPVTKQPGDLLAAGTLNQSSAVILRITEARQHTFNLLQSLIERAAAEKSRLAELADRGARQFIASTLVTALLIGLTWLWIDSSRAFWIVIAVLVVTCPCALSLATPTALTRAMLILKRKGLIITRGYALERLADIKAIAFDKTGTLTDGQFSLTKVRLTDLGQRLKITDEEAVILAACLEETNNHPIAQAFKAVPLPDDRCGFTQHSYLPSLGVAAVNARGRWFLGNLDGSSSTDQRTTDLALTLDDQPIAWLQLCDQIRPTVAATLMQLKQAGVSSHVLTGDSNPAKADEYKELGLTGSYLSHCSPEDKVNWVMEHPQKETLAVVGDGLNDAPLLASGHLSVAMLNAADLTKTQADVLMLTSDLQVLATAIRLAKNTRRTIRQNLGWALLYNIVALPLAGLGWVSPWQAALGMSLSSLLVVGNALRLKAS